MGPKDLLRVLFALRGLSPSEWKVLSFLVSEWAKVKEFSPLRGILASYSKIGVECGLSITSVWGALRKLEARGLIRRKQRWRMGEGKGRAQVVFPGRELLRLLGWRMERKGGWAGGF